MHIVCPYCTTSYAIKLASLGANGRTVRCSRCKETWMAHPEDAVEEASVPAMAAASRADDQSDLAEQWNSYAKDDGAAETPVVDSPSIASDWPTEDAGETADEWAAAAPGRRGGRRRRRAAPVVVPQPVPSPRRAGQPHGSPPRRRENPMFGLPTACAAMGALVLALGGLARRHGAAAAANGGVLQNGRA